MIVLKTNDSILYLLYDWLVIVIYYLMQEPLILFNYNFCIK